MRQTIYDDLSDALVKMVFVLEEAYKDMGCHTLLVDSLGQMIPGALQWDRLSPDTHGEAAISFHNAAARILELVEQTYPRCSQPIGL